VKLLVTGYSRSGTTLLRRLIAGHPQVFAMLHETMLLVANRGNIVNAHILWGWAGGQPFCLGRAPESPKAVWGEKILYDYPNVDYCLVSAYDYALFWNEVFGGYARIVNILRHPFDVILSSAAKRKITISKVVKLYLHHMPDTCNNIDALPNTLHVRFETLVQHPVDALECIFTHCGLEVNDRSVSKVIGRVSKEIGGGIIADAASKWRKDWSLIRQSTTPEQYERLQEVVKDLLYA